MTGQGFLQSALLHRQKKGQHGLQHWLLPVQE